MPGVTGGNAELFTFTTGNKFFELSNYLGNVLATVSDKHIGVDSNSNGYSDYYLADVVTANDYYPFGMQMPGRKYSAGSGYRYGFNGKENDKDAGEGVQDYGLRVYDSRLGKFLSVDPLTKSYPHYTPYSFAGNKPIQFIDLDGGEEKPFNSPGNMEPVGKVQSYVTQEGADARIYNVKEMGKTYTIARMVTYKNAQNNTQSSMPVITYLVKDPNLINPSNVSSGCNTLFTTAGTNWHYWQTNLELSQSQEVTKSSLKQFGTGVFGVAVGLAALPGIIAAAPTVSSAISNGAAYLAPKPGFNPTDAAWDFINQTVVQGKSLNEVNFGSTITAGIFGNGNVVSNALWGATGSFTNLSVKNISSGGSILNLNKEGLVGFASNAAGNLLSGGASKAITSLNSQIIINSTVRSAMNKILGNAMEASGQGMSNVIEQNLSPKK
ncbi:hypothetical protein GCM10027043_04180 [Ferruginibacter profundus]